MAKSPLVTKFEKLKSIRSRQAFCPVANLRAVVTPLTVSDDLSLKTMVTSPDLYDRQMSILLYNHTEFPDIAGPKPSFDQFISLISDFDKKSLLFAIYDATYGTLGSTKITCPKPDCRHTSEVVINAKDLLQPDTIKAVWDKPTVFQDYSIAVDIPLGDTSGSGISRIVFNMAIPTIKTHLDTLKLISIDDLKDNFDKTNSIVSKTEELVMLTKSISIYGEDELVPDDTVTSQFEMHTIVQNYISLDVVGIVIDAFDKEFSMYNPEFKKSLKCSNCGHNFDLPVDIEVALYRSFLRL